MNQTAMHAVIKSAMTAASVASMKSRRNSVIKPGVPDPGPFGEVVRCWGSILVSRGSGRRKSPVAEQSIGCATNARQIRRLNRNADFDKASLTSPWQSGLGLTPPWPIG